MTKHCYLFALEVQPLNDELYDDLPLHCTLMHRFWSELSPDILADKVRSYLEGVPQVMLSAHEHMLLGPKRMAVSEIAFSGELKQLHMGLYELLNSLTVEYTAPEWVGAGYKAHVSDRGDVRLEVGTQHISQAIYLIEVEVPGHEGQRMVRAKFNLKG